MISSVGGFKEPPVDRFIAGYQAGAKEAAPGIEALNGYSQDWDDLAKCKELALNQIPAGAEVVFQVAGGCGLGALDAASERDVWGIGVDADQSFLGPHVLTSAQKKVDQAVFQTIKSVQDGDLAGRPQPRLRARPGRRRPRQDLEARSAGRPRRPGGRAREDRVGRLADVPTSLF